MTDYHLQLHLTRLFTWLAFAIGRAFGLSFLIAGAVGLGAALTGEPGMLWLAAILCPLVFAGVLYASQAPMPYDVEDGDEYQADVDARHREMQHRS